MRKQKKQRESKGGERHSRESSQQLSKRGGPSAPTEARGSDGSTTGRRRGKGGSGRRSWLQTHGRDLRFLVSFALLMGLYYLATTTTFAKETFFPSYLRLNAQAAGVILKACGYDVTVHGLGVTESRFSIQVGRGCDAVEPSALFVSAVLSSPVALTARLSAAIVGTVLLMTINLTRIISLLLTGIYAPRLFDAMHLDVWQAVFIFLAILFWALWASRLARRRRAQRRHASS